MTQKEFLEKAQAVHKDKYDYSITEFKCTQDKVKITCRIHGVFEQGAATHLKGSGCQKCPKPSSALKELKAREEFLQQATAVHQDRYDYRHVKNVLKPVTIICKLHGEFKQAKRNHLRGGGCPTCRVISRKESFLKRAIEIHKGKYSYSKMDFKNRVSKIEIICPVHGSFFQRPAIHIEGWGCRKCSAKEPSIWEKQLAEYLKQKGIRFEPEKSWSDCKCKSQLRFDFYL